MGRLWDADWDVTPEAAARAIEQQFPALAPVQLETLGVGWDNVAFLVNDAWAFRFPRRRMGVGLIEREMRVLPLLAPHLPLPIPNPVFVGTPGPDFPHPFAGYAHLPETTACRMSWSDAARAANAAPLGRFLHALHTLPIAPETRAWAPDDDIARADMPARLPTLAERLETVAALLPDLDTSTLLDAATQLATAPPRPGPTVWVHGDLYARHLLVDTSHALCGVIDWGDVHLGDPAIDVGIAFSFLPPEARAAFRAAYDADNTDAGLWDRARFRALHYGAVLVPYGADQNDAAIQAAGEYALRNALEDSLPGL